MEIEETPLEFLRNFKRILTLSMSGYGSMILLIDEYIRMAEKNPECLVNHPGYIDQKLEDRKVFSNAIDILRKEIELIDSEIKREIISPSSAPMIYRILKLFQHL